ncbi:hypothetical protein NCLIV_024360 [Neospora caninum Liverpool]|uniref:Bromodomain-containing protein n=1 Tax=Neospora caninum (strain Liverpool) TaxID=572307 RepID=F0VG04_NEOCL|nr:hypothetical protein NCLIV_024360 [Neospora caninum Liverpool]CBZ52648.1 hypothetical protein NCLIV_024360 [Neospora caninum Liverpool]CEL66625.1 TPA: bromodomain-containing protein [Neospora caninum Liverpool]|eukprot:XP_003882680.1 hypothetical protein NCLIV_024360 [Neospora caninum Liverpool]
MSAAAEAVGGASGLSAAPVAASPSAPGVLSAAVSPGVSLAVSPFFPLFRLARHEPVDAVKEAFEKTFEKHRQELVERHPSLEASALQALQEKLIQDQHLLVDPTSRGTLLFEIAQRSKDEEAVELAKFLVDEKRVLTVAQRDRMQQTCLFYAAREGHVALCRFFIERGCDPNAQDTVGQTCLFYASREGRAACIAEILDRGGNPNLIDINRQSCLFYAARDNRLDAVRVLLEKGADPHVKDTLRKTAWHFAKANNHLAVCSLLKGSGGGGAQTSAAAVGARGPVPVRSCSSISSLSSFSSFSGAAPTSPNAGSAGLATGAETPAASLETPDGAGNGQAGGSGKPAPGVGEAACGEEVPQRKKYRLQFRPLPDECPDLWLNAGNEKLTEFERLFPALSVWRRDAQETGSAAQTSNEGGASVASQGAKEASQNHYDSIRLALLQNAQQAALGTGSPGMDLLGLWQSAASALLSELSKYEGGHIFEKPVDPKTAPGYYDVVTRPMSLSCIKAKIRKSDYAHPQQFLKDVEQVFINCEIYNQQGSWVWSIGKNMQKFFTNQVMITRFQDYVDKYNKIYNVLAECEQENQRAKAARTDGDTSGQPEEPKTEETPNASSLEESGEASAGRSDTVELAPSVESAGAEAKAGEESGDSGEKGEKAMKRENAPSAGASDGEEARSRESRKAEDAETGKSEDERRRDSRRSSAASGKESCGRGEEAKTEEKESKRTEEDGGSAKKEKDENKGKDTANADGRKRRRDEAGEAAT